MSNEMSQDDLVDVMSMSDDDLHGVWKEREVMIRDASTLRQAVTLVRVGVAFFARQQKYTAPATGFHPEAHEMRWAAFAWTIVDLVTSAILEHPALPWVRRAIRSLAFEELELQTREWHRLRALEQEAELEAAIRAFRKADR